MSDPTTCRESTWERSRQEPTGVEDVLSDAHLFRIEAVPAELEEITQVSESGQAPEGMSIEKKQILAMKVAPYTMGEFVNGYYYSKNSNLKSLLDQEN